nr:MAG TPA: hypothetical protein [Caudoviricetes sp.]
MNKEELLKQYDEKAKALRDEFISKLEDGKKEFEVKLPYKHDTLYFFDFVDNEIYITGFSSSEKDITRFLHGYYFKTKEEVEQHLKERKLLFKLQQWAKIKNGDWEPDWSDIENKYIIVYLNNRKHFTVESMWTVNRFYILPYFKTEELAQECIELFGDEIKEVLC